MIMRLEPLLFTT
ncbi:hypothetical protein RDI58_017821 [Solanum bulbocastanum]|uniref:Uncharacterized protein n=1 Tax=Solanum bulbocastanum TaxID=147425 RepID=A0AAN8TFB7_SOLBU